MIKIGLTGSIASGKTTASKILSKKKGPLFNADKVVKQLYKKISFKKTISKTFNLKLDSNLQKNLKIKILQNNKNLKKLETIVHPLVRKEMLRFTKIYRNRKILFFEIPLLVESRLSSYFDLIILIKSSKFLRLKRYKLKKKNVQLFNLLDKKQMHEDKKMKYCDHIVVNNKSLSILKIKLFNIIKLYE